MRSTIWSTACSSCFALLASPDSGLRGTPFSFFGQNSCCSNPMCLLVRILLCIDVLFGHVGIFFFSDRGSFLVLSAPWQAGSPPRLRAQVCALADVRGTCSGGSKWQVPSERDSDHVESSRPMQTYLHYICGTV